MEVHEEGRKYTVENLEYPKCNPQLPTAVTLITMINHMNLTLISKQIQLYISNTCLYWTLTASQRRRIEAAEMKLLRPLAGYTLYDHKTNNTIRQELRVTSVLDKIDEYRKNWLLHLQRMPQNRIPLKLYYRPQGRRTIGRPKKRWREQL
jgi:hypothetical protein